VIDIIKSEGLDTKLKEDLILSMAQNEEFILTTTQNGYGKRTSSYEYRLTNRGGSGVANIITSTRNGGVVSSKVVDHNDQIILVTDKGKLIRCPVVDIRITSRNTQGVVLFKTADKEIVVSTARVVAEEGNGQDFEDEEQETNFEN
jgi:DNA gyrase subunit A